MLRLAPMKITLWRAKMGKIKSIAIHVILSHSLAVLEIEGDIEESNIVTIDQIRPVDYTTFYYCMNCKDNLVAQLVVRIHTNRSSKYDKLK